MTKIDFFRHICTLTAMLTAFVCFLAYLHVNGNANGICLFFLAFKRAL